MAHPEVGCHREAEKRPPDVAIRSYQSHEQEYFPGMVRTEIGEVSW